MSSRAIAMLVAVGFIAGVSTARGQSTWSDDFEDGVIDASLWMSGGQSRTNTGIGGSWDWSVDEVVDVDGHVNMHVCGPGESNTTGAEAWIRTLYNYNDGSSHVVNFTWEVVVQESHENKCFIQVTDGYISSGGYHWPEGEAPIPGTTDLLWRVPDEQEYHGAVFPDGLAKTAWSITIHPSGVARLYDGPNASGSLVREESLGADEWYIRLLIKDGTSYGFGEGGMNLNLYDFCSEPTATMESIPAVSEWGLVAMTLLVLTAGTLVYARRRLAHRTVA